MAERGGSSAGLLYPPGLPVFLPYRLSQVPIARSIVGLPDSLSSGKLKSAAPDSAALGDSSLL